MYAQNAADPAARVVQSSLVVAADKNTPGPYALDRIAVADADGNGCPDMVMMTTYPFRDVTPPYEWLTYGRASGGRHGHRLAVSPVRTGQLPDLYAGLLSYFVDLFASPADPNNINFPSFAIGTNQAGAFYPGAVQHLYDGLEHQQVTNPHFQSGLTIDSATGELAWVPTAADAGTVRVRDPFAPLTTDTRDVTVRVAVPVVPPVVPPVVVPRITVGGGNGVVRTFTAGGAPKLTLTPFGDFAGVVRVAVAPATADTPAAVVTGSGDPGRVTAHQPTRPPTVRFDLNVFPDVATGVYVG